MILDTITTLLVQYPLQYKTKKMPEEILTGKNMVIRVSRYIRSPLLAAFLSLSVSTIKCSNPTDLIIAMEKAWNVFQSYHVSQILYLRSLHEYNYRYSRIASNPFT